MVIILSYNSGYRGKEEKKEKENTFHKHGVFSKLMVKNTFLDINYVNGKKFTNNFNGQNFIPISKPKRSFFTENDLLAKFSLFDTLISPL